jgi:peptidyl-prolyl cis-trans isomerase C
VRFLGVEPARPFQVILLLISLFFAAAGSGAAESVNSPSPIKKGNDPSTPVASVNGVAISLGELNRAMAERIPETGHRSLSEKRWTEIRAEVLDNLIVQEILYQESKRLEIKVSPDSIDDEVQRIRARFPSREAFQKAVEAQGLTLDEIRRGVERYLAIRQLTDQAVLSKVSITDDQMKSYYDGHREQFTMPEQIRLRVLLIGVDPSGRSEDWEKGRLKAQGLADRAKKGADFAELVRQYSDNTEFKAQGGDTGLIHQGRLPYPEVETAAFAEPVGAIGAPVRTLYGYVVFQVEEKKPAQPMAFENLNKEFLRKEIQESATQAKLKEWIDGLRSKADVKIY